MAGTPTTLREIAAALAVLAIVFLNFAHAPLAPPMAGTGVAAVAMDAGYCGDPLSPEADHAPCHACRIGGGAVLPEPAAIDLPVPPETAICARTYAERADFGWPGSGRPRAPPAA